MKGSCPRKNHWLRKRVEVSPRAICAKAAGFLPTWASREGRNWKKSTKQCKEKVHPAHQLETGVVSVQVFSKKGGSTSCKIPIGLQRFPPHCQIWAIQSYCSDWVFSPLQNQNKKTDKAAMGSKWNYHELCLRIPRAMWMLRHRNNNFTPIVIMNITLLFGRGRERCLWSRLVCTSGYALVIYRAIEYSSFEKNWCNPRLGLGTAVLYSVPLPFSPHHDPKKRPWPRMLPCCFCMVVKSSKVSVRTGGLQNA